MSMVTREDRAIGSHVQVAAMAQVVAELLGGGLPRLEDAAWLRERAATAGLATHEYGALESLRVRLQQGGSSLLDAVADLRWN